MAEIDGLPRLSEKQEISIVESDARMNIWHGSVRSSKTIASLIRWLIYVANAPLGGQLVVSGKTSDTIARNVFGPLQDPMIVGKEIAQHVKYTRGAQVAHILGRQIEIISTNDARAEGRLRGMTCAGAYCDELTLFAEDFFTQLLGRMSVPGAQLFATTNPGAPTHWVKKKYLDREHEMGDDGRKAIDLKSWYFNLDDNPALTDEYKRNIKAEFTGLWYKRMVLGEWCLAEGAVYDMFDEDVHVVDPDDVPVITQWLGVGIDYGTTNPFHAVVIGLGTDHCLYVVDEYRYDSRKMRRQLTNSEYSQKFAEWLMNIPVPGTTLRGIRPPLIVVDPSAASFKVQLYRDGIVSMDANNDVLNGILNVSTLFSQHKLKISSRAKHLIEEIQGYGWDPAYSDRGVDQPIKVNDHGADALRYILHITEPRWRHLIRT